jgi:hypothetical protein
MESAGLYEQAVAVFVRVIGDENELRKFAQITKPYRKLHVIYSDKGNDFEVSTLQALQFFTNETMSGRFHADIDVHVLYLHTKGVFSGRQSQAMSSCMNDWRDYMEFFLIDHYKDAIIGLGNNFDVCGVNWRVQSLFGPMVGHFSGNFWWSSMRYLYTLPEIKSDWDRAYYEFWIGQGSPRVHNMWESHVNHYQSRYLRDEYARAFGLGLNTGVI